MSRVKAIVLTVMGAGIALYGGWMFVVGFVIAGVDFFEMFLEPEVLGSATFHFIFVGIGSYLMFYAKRFWKPVKTKETEQHS